jgi:putative phosphoesterase
MKTAFWDRPYREGMSPPMRVGILSDTHDQVARTKVAVSRLLDAGAEVLVHCGDITVPEVVYELNALPSYFVFGNCDDDIPGLTQAIVAIGGTCLEWGSVITLAGRRVAITHSHLDHELHRLESQRPDYLLTGHTHRAADVRRGSVRAINPGALHRAASWTVALLDLERDELCMLTICNTSMRT